MCAGAVGRAPLAPLHSVTSCGRSEQVEVPLVGRRAVADGGGGGRLLELRHRCSRGVDAAVDQPDWLVAHLRFASVVGHELRGVLKVVPVALHEVCVEARAATVQACLRCLASDVGVLDGRVGVKADVREPALEAVGLRGRRDEAHDHRDRAEGAQHRHGAFAHLRACRARHGHLRRRPSALASVSDNFAMRVHVEDVGRCALWRDGDRAIVGELALQRADLAREAHLALKVLLLAGAVLADDRPLELLAVEALRGLLPPGVGDLSPQHALVRVAAVRRVPRLIVRGHRVGGPNALAQWLAQRLKVHVVHDARVATCAVEEKLCRGRVGLGHDVVDLDGVVGKLEVVPALALVPGEDDLLCLADVVGHYQKAAVVPKLIDEGAFVSLDEREAAVAGEVGVGLVRLESQVRPDVAGAHDYADGVLCRVEWRVVVEVGDAVQVQPTPVRRAVDLLPQGVDLRGLQVGPETALVEGDHRADDALVLGLGLGPASLVDLRPGVGGLLERVGLLRSLGVLAGDPLLGAVVPQARDVSEVRQVDALHAQHLVELAVSAAAAHVVGER
mmetsp:Transcript_72036/g.188782  ORF Transcript_72036/g.188782 Transcript_72036/m.188782 type:complete len:561 (+) Transcript_72036:102-1784(+)